MATSASQPYIARLGFQDPDRSKDRHGLGCEYLYERLIELEVAPPLRKTQCNHLRRVVEESINGYASASETLRDLSDKGDYSWIVKQREEACAAANALLAKREAAASELEALETSDGTGYARRVCKPSDCINVPIRSGYSVVGFADVLIRGFLGEVKITRQPAEQVLQQINFYKAHHSGISTTYILTDYDCSDLQRLTQGSDVKVFRLGRRFEQWLVMRSTPVTPEL